MSFEISFLREEAAQYVTRHVALPYPVMERMESEIAKEEQPAVGRGAGSLLRTLAAMTQSRRAVEVGTNIGYSALWLLAGMREDGRVDTIEMDAGIARRAADNFAEAGVEGRVRIHQAKATAALPRIDGPVDIVFLDAAKAEYPQYLDHAHRLLRSGGVVAADNAFWLGRAWDDEFQDADTLGVRELARRAFTGEHWAAATLVPVEDGVLVAVKR